MEINFQNICKTDILTEQDSDILITLNSKLSLSQAQIKNQVKKWHKF